MPEDHLRIESLFAQFLIRVDAGEELDFEAYVAEHRDAADGLRRMRTEWQAFQALQERLMRRDDDAPSPTAMERTRELVARLFERRTTTTRYRIEGEIGRGGMGRVLRAWDPDLRRELAMKLLREDGGADARSARLTERFLEEAQIAGQLHHPGIVPIHELGLDAEGRAFYTMPLIDGEDLQRIFERSWRGDPAWTRTRVLNVLSRVCETMSYAHSRGVVHRDLKPANVMVGRFGEVYVMDWGLARVAGESAPHRDGDPIAPSDASVSTARHEDLLSSPEARLLSAFAGTPAYMAPEQALGPRAAPDPRADVYAVGAMLYAILAGCAPHADALRGAVDLRALREIHARKPRPVRELAKDLAPELEAICERAMAPSPSDRYASMRELADDLRSYLEGRTVRAYATGALAELEKWIGRNRATAAALLALVVTLAVGLAVSTTLYFRSEESAAAAAMESERVLRLSDLKRHQALVDAAESAWPARPERAPDYERWLAEARTLGARLAVHRDTLAELRRGARADADGRWTFANAEAQWHHDTLAELVLALERFVDPRDGLVADVERRLAFARSVDARTVSGKEANASWSEALRSIADASECPQYAGLSVRPQIGLLPIGRDPESGMWEFAHLQSGEPAVRRDDGTLEVRPETGIVLVLVPAGRFLMGAQSERADLPNYSEYAFANEAPVHEVLLDAYFLSKFEMTQAQWQRFTGSNPSSFQPDGDATGALRVTATHPVETVGRGQCARVLHALDLDLPTEAQWEYAARAGTTTSWWTGDDERALDGAANLADQTVLRAGGEWPQIETWLDDGWFRHAPVDALRANAFGLHHVHGNVWEWCKDDFGSYELPARAGDGLRVEPHGGPCVGRGGGYVNNAAYSRSSIRDSRPDVAHMLFGVRPSRRLDP